MYRSNYNMGSVVPQYQQPYFLPNNYGQQSVQANYQANPNTIQTIQKQSISPSVQCYFVKNKEELASLDAQPNTVYIGINQDSDELYIRQWNNDGKIDFDTYNKVSQTKEKTDFEKIQEQLNSIQEVLNERITSTNGATSNSRSNAEQPLNGYVQPDDGEQDNRPATSNTAQYSKKQGSRH